MISNSTGLFQVPQQENLQMQEYDAAVSLVQTSDKVNKSDIVTETNVKAPENVNDWKQPATSLLDTVRELKTLNETINCPELEAHECDVFATHIARQLKQLNAASCILAEQDIQGVVTRYRMRDLLNGKVVTSVVSYHTPPHNQITSHPVHHQHNLKTQIRIFQFFIHWHNLVVRQQIAYLNLFLMCLVDCLRTHTLNFTQM